MLRRRVAGQCTLCASLPLLPGTHIRTYVYQPPGTGSNDTSRLPWYHHATPTSAAFSEHVSKPAAAAQSSSPLHLQDLSAILQETTTTTPAAAAATTNAASVAATAGTAQANAASAPAQRVVKSDGAVPSSSPSSYSSSSSSISFAAAAAAVASAAALRRSDTGALRLTPARRMSAISGPTLDARVEDIVKVEEVMASELTLPKVVQLLIDPKAEGVERITMSEFAAMQPKRQLLAVAGNREWLQWIEQSTYYQQAARLAAESPAQDLAALQQAGITSLQQWLDHPQLVKVSSRTRSALDTAVAQSVEAYMAEVVHVVNTSNEVEGVLTHWVSDVMGKFILDSLQVSVDRASQAMWTARRDWMPADVVRNGGTAASGSSNNSNSSSSSGGGGAGQSVESRMLSDLLNGSSGKKPTAASSSPQQTPVLRAGEVCTLDHYLRFVQKVVSSVRTDYVANHAAMGRGAAGRGDAQAEQEIAERSASVIAAAFTQLLEQAVRHSLPPQLAPLQQHGYLALDRVPGLLKRAGNLLQLRSVPVRYFVFHSTVDEGSANSSSGGAAAAGQTSRVSGYSSSAAASASSSSSSSAAGGLAVEAPPFYPPGTFLTGSSQMDVTLGEWSGSPDPPSSTARESGAVVDDATEQEYLSMLHRLRRRVDTLAVTSLYEVFAQPERYGGSGFSAADAIGLHQLFGPVKLLEDRLSTALHYPVAAAEKPLHFIEAGPLSGKTALLEQLAERAARPGDKVVLVRYGGSQTPYVPDLDDHPVAFAARFWFRVALASCPYLIRTEELYSRAPQSVHWWGHEKNWSWERYQSLLQSARNAGAGHRQHQQQQQQSASSGAAVLSAPAQLASVLVDDVDRALSAMQQKWGDAAALSAAALQLSQNAFSSVGGGGSGGSLLGGLSASPSASSSLAAATAAALRAQEAEERAVQQENSSHNDDDEDYDGAASSGGGEGDGSSSGGARRALAFLPPAPSLEQQRQQVLSLWHTTGKSVTEHLSRCFTQLSAAVGQVNFVFTGAAVSPLLLAHCPAPCRRYYLPLSGGVGLQPRLRVLPLLATLHALHLTHHLDMPGLLYEVLKNCPALTGKALELFWSHRVSTMDLRTGLPRLTMGSGSAHPQLVQSYVPRELFAELPLYTSLLQNPRRTRRRLVELLQRQLSSPTGYLSTELDTTPQDIKDGLVLPHNLTSSQVHPFALFAIFSRQDAIDERVFNSEGQLLDGAEAAAEAAGGEKKKNSSSGSGEDAEEEDFAALSDAAAAARVRTSTGVGSNERKVVRAWAEVWAEYRSVVATLSTSPRRKRDAMRILLHGALLLRSAAVAGAQLELNLKVPSYGFPLLASEVRVRGSHSSNGGAGAAGAAAGQPHTRGDANVRLATPETVRRAISAYKMFFSNAAPSHFPFRPMVGLNGGCDVVFVCGSTLALYDIVTTTAQLRQMVGRFAEALLGVLHVLDRQVLPVDKVRAVQFVTVVSLDEARPGFDSTQSGGAAATTAAAAVAVAAGRRRSGAGAGGLSVDVFSRPAAAATVPYYLDYSAIFEDAVMDRLRELQLALGITRDFRTLHELIDEIERTHRVRVMQDVVSTPEEVESLFSPTLLQLVPDSTVLPAYTSAIVTAADLMMQVMKGSGGKAAAVSGGAAAAGGSGLGVGGAAGVSGSTGAGVTGVGVFDDTVNLNDDDDDDEADYVNLGEEEALGGAELDDVANEVRLSRDGAVKLDPLAADQEHLHESAELLEAIMNDNLDLMSDSSARLREQHEQTARELRRDLVMEDRINYNAPAPTAGVAPAAGAAGVAQGRAAGSGGVGGGSVRSAAEEAEADALAWLHDIITPESLVAGLKGTAPGAGTPLANAVSATPSAAAAAPPLAGAAAAGGGGGGGGIAPSPLLQQQNQQNQQQQSNVSAAGVIASPMAARVSEPWTPNPPLSGGTESISAVFPRTAAKRDAAEAAAVGATATNNSAKADDSKEGGSEEGGPDSDGAAAEAGEEEEEEEELNLQALFDAVGEGRRRNRGGANRASAGRRASGGSKAKRGAVTSATKAKTATKRKKPASSSSSATTAAASKKKPKAAAAASAGKKTKNASAKKKKK